MKKGIGITLGVIAFLALVLVVARPKSLKDRLETSATTQNESSQISESKGLNNATAPSLEAVAAEASSEYQLAIADFEADLYGGGQVKLSDVSSEKPTIIGFWATWCHNCQRNMPGLSKLSQQYSKEVNVIMVNLGEDKNTVDSWLKDKGFNFLVAYDEDGTIGNNYGIRYTNTHVLLDRSGQLVDAFPGDVNENHFEQLLQI